MVKFLVGKNATIDVLANGAWTPLHYASEEGKYSVVVFLVENGADISKKILMVKHHYSLLREKDIKLLRTF